LASLTWRYYFFRMKITSKGQVTIPQEMRERHGLHPQMEVEFASGEGGVVIRPARTQKGRFREWLVKARGSATGRLTTDEVMRLTRGEE
jgi:AbrB family looped-hinge helix DNA binding protein